MSKTQIVSEKTIEEFDLFSIIKTRLVVKNGSEKIYTSIKRDPAISILPITPNYEIYLINQYRYSHKKYLLEAIAGFIDKGETPKQAAIRELKEEGGISAEEIIPLSTIDSAGSIALWKQHLFLAKQLTLGENKLEEDEEVELIKLSLEDAVLKVFSGEITTAPSVIIILFAYILKLQGKL